MDSNDSCELWSKICLCFTIFKGWWTCELVLWTTYRSHCSKCNNSRPKLESATSSLMRTSKHLYYSLLRANTFRARLFYSIAVCGDDSDTDLRPQPAVSPGTRFNERPSSRFAYNTCPSISLVMSSLQRKKLAMKYRSKIVRFNRHTWQSDRRIHEFQIWQWIAVDSLLGCLPYARILIDMLPW